MDYIVVPDHLLPAIFNGDTSHFEEGDEADLQEFYRLAGEQEPTDCESVGFKYRNDVSSLGANCSNVYLG